MKTSLVLADDYKLVSWAGTALDQARFVARSADPHFKRLPFTVAQPLHTVWSDGAVLGSQVNCRIVDHGKPDEQFLLFADRRVVYAQVSPAKAP